MSTVAIGAEIAVSQEGPPRKRWTRAECELLEKSGLWDGQHFELIEGELYNKMGKGRRHTNALKFLRGWLVLMFGEDCIDTEASIEVSPEDNPTSDPEPDIILLARSSFEFSVNPTPTDIQLLVEVSDTTRVFDRTTKASLYARAGIAEYWVLDVNERSLTVHREPGGGEYRSVKTHAEQEMAMSGVVKRPFVVSELFQRSQ